MCVYDKDNHRLLLKNNTDQTLCYRLLADTANWEKGLYVFYISAQDSTRPLFVRGGDGNWKSFLDEYSPDSTLNIYLFDTAGIDSNKLSERIIIQRRYKRLRFKIPDLDNLKWRIEISKQDIASLTK